MTDELNDRQAISAPEEDCPPCDESWLTGENEQTDCWGPPDPYEDNREAELGKMTTDLGLPIPVLQGYLLPVEL